MQNNHGQAGWAAEPSFGRGLVGESTSRVAPLPSAWSATFESRDDEQIRQHIGGFLRDFSMERSGASMDYRLRHRQASFGALRVHDLEHTQASGELRLEAPALSDVYVLELNLSGEAVICGERRNILFELGHLYVINPDQVHRKLWRADNRRLLIGIDQGSIEGILSEMTGGPLPEPLLFDAEPKPIDASTASIARAVAMIYADLDAGGAGLSQRRAAKSAERLLIELLIEAYPNNFSHLLERNISYALPGYMKRALRFVEEYGREPIGPDDIALAGNVSTRTIYDGFRRYCGVPPMAYVRSVRLEFARQMLVAGAPAGIQVTQVAMDCGFNHLGKFARAYRERFAEPPSETLKHYR